MLVRHAPAPNQLDCRCQDFDVRAQRHSLTGLRSNSKSVLHNDSDMLLNCISALLGSSTEQLRFPGADWQVFWPNASKYSVLRKVC